MRVGFLMLSRVSTSISGLFCILQMSASDSFLLPAMHWAIEDKKYCCGSGFSTPSNHNEAPIPRLDVIRHFSLDCFHVAALVEILAEAMAISRVDRPRLVVEQILPLPTTALASPRPARVASEEL